MTEIDTAAIAAAGSAVGALFAAAFATHAKLRDAICDADDD